MGPCAGRPWEATARRQHLLAKKRGASGETNPANTLISGFQPLALRENKFLLLNPPLRWYFVMAAWADSYRRPKRGKDRITDSRDGRVWAGRHLWLLSRKLPCTLYTSGSKLNEGLLNYFNWIISNREIAPGSEDSLWKREGKLREFSVSALYFLGKEIEKQMDWICYLVSTYRVVGHGGFRFMYK